MKTTIFFLLMYSLSVFSSTHPVFFETCKSNSNLQRMLEHNLKTKGCDSIVKEISKLKSFSQFIFPNRKVSKKRSILTSPWTDDFPHLYGINDRLLKDQFLSRVDESDKGNFDNFLRLDDYKEFLNLTDISFLPEYFYFKNPGNICKILKQFPQIDTVTVSSSILKNPIADQCLSKLRNGIIIRDNFKGFIFDLKSKIIGIEFFTGNIADLERFKSLRYLGISKETKTLKGIESIYKHSDLSHLSINIQNQLPDLEKVSFLQGIEYLNINCSEDDELNNPSPTNCSNNSLLNNINFISDMTFLQHLNLANNAIQDITAVQDLIDLKYLNLKGNKINRLPNFGKLSKLEYVDLSDNQLSDLMNVRDLKNLTFLGLARNNIQDISTISGLKNLRFLNLSGNSDLFLDGEIFHLENLEIINLDHDLYSQRYNNQSRMLDFDFAEYANERLLIFETLYSDNNRSSKSTTNRCNRNERKIKNISAKTFPSLKILSMRRNGLKTAPNTNSFFNLKLLDLSDNEISNFDPSDYSTMLEQLILNSNNLESYPELKNFTNLKKLFVFSNFISDLKNFYQTPLSLEVIHLGSNRISDISTIDELVTFNSRENLDIYLSFNFIQKNYCDTFPGNRSADCNVFRNWSRKDLGFQNDHVDAQTLHDTKAQAITLIKEARCK